jgi:hypothetical protein
MIDLSGLDPDRDVDIEIVGRRAGEKLHEELFNGYERPQPTSAEKILLAEREPLAVDAVEAMFAEIGLLVLEGDAAGLAAKVSELSATRLEAQSKGVGGPAGGREALPTGPREYLRDESPEDLRDDLRDDLPGHHRDELPDDLPDEESEDPRDTPAPLIHSRDP